jgi:transposase-like protein
VWEIIGNTGAMRKKFTPKYKADAVLEVLREAESIKQIAGRRDVHPNMLGRWKAEATKNLYTLFEDNRVNEKRAYEAQLQVLYAQIGELTAKLSWLKKKFGIEV